MIKKALIDFSGSKLTIKHQCELLGLPRSTAYHVPVVPTATKVEIDIKNSIKWERLYLMYPETVSEVKAITREYTKHYNYERGHQSYGCKTPAEIYMNSVEDAA